MYLILHSLNFNLFVERLKTPELHVGISFSQSFKDIFMVFCRKFSQSILQRITRFIQGMRNWQWFSIHRDAFYERIYNQIYNCSYLKKLQTSERVRMNKF